MFKSWGTGILGSLVIIIGVFLAWASFFAGMAAEISVLLGIISIAIGSYMKYVSNQSVKVVKLPKEYTVEYSSSKNASARIFLAAEQTLSNDAFKLYLIEYFKISKHDLLGQYVLNEQLYSTLNDALLAAKSLYSNKV